MKTSLGAHFSSFPLSADSATLGSCRYKVKALPLLHFTYSFQTIKIKHFCVSHIVSKRRQEDNFIHCLRCCVRVGGIRLWVFLSCLMWFIGTTLGWLGSGKINVVLLHILCLQVLILILSFLGMSTPNLYDNSSFLFTLTCLWGGALPIWAIESQTGLGWKGP